MLTNHKAGRRTTAQFSRPSVIPTAGGALGDGVLLELIQGDAATKPPRLLIWDGQRVQLAQGFKRDDVTYVPIQLDPTLASAVRLPTGVMEYGSTRELFTEVSALISRATYLSDQDVAPISSSVFASWLPECLPLAPLLWIIAPATASTGPLSQLLGLLCRRVLFVAELTLTGLRSVCMQFKPTIITEVPAASRPLIRALRASSRQGTYVAAGDKMLDLSCARIVFANEPLSDPAMAGFPLEIALAPTRGHIPLMKSAEAERVAAEFQAKFLQYRLVNYNKVTVPSFNLDEFTAPTQQLANNLAACIVGDDDLQARVLPLLKQRDNEIRVDRAALLRSIVLEGLLAACHDTKLFILPIIYLTEMVNTIRAGRGEVLQVSPEKVGWDLRALGFWTEFITGGRKGLMLDDATRNRVHTLAAAYSVRTLEQSEVTSLCRHCAALRLRWKGRADPGKPPKSFMTAKM